MQFYNLYLHDKLALNPTVTNLSSLHNGKKILSVDVEDAVKAFSFKKILTAVSNTLCSLNANFT